MNLLKIENIIQDGNDYDDYETDNLVWNTDGYPVNDIINDGISINCRHCVEYIDGYPYVNLEKLNAAKLNTFGYVSDKKYITFVVFDSKSVAFVGDKDIIERYKKSEIDDGLSIELSIDEWMIKKLLE